MNISSAYASGEYEIPYHLTDHNVPLLAQKSLEYVFDHMILIADRIPLALHGHDLIKEVSSQIRVTTLTIEAKESLKTLATIQRLIDAALSAGADRKSTIASFGGGLTANMAGVVSGLLFRGLPLLHFSTTLLGVTDGILSLKQAVNGPYGKNQIGLFQAPTAILCDVAWLSTLPEKEVQAGLVEAAKNALIFDRSFFERLQRIPFEKQGVQYSLEFLQEVIRSKQNIMKNDPKECREALMLEYGHTVGHALELTLDGINHGHAVALGMRIAAKIAELRGWLTPRETRLHNDCVSHVGGLVHPDQPFDIKELLSRVRHDNKRGYIPCGSNETAMVLLKDQIGKVAWTHGLPLTPVALTEIEKAIDELGWVFTTTSSGVSHRSVSRHHGFGNVLALLSLINGTSSVQYAWKLITRPEWQSLLRPLAEKHVTIIGGAPDADVNLDAATVKSKPTTHRIEEFTQLLNLKNVLPSTKTIPSAWKQKWRHLSGKTVVANDAGHPARVWPDAYVTRLITQLGPENCIWLGKDKKEETPEAYDLRGVTTLEDVFGILANASCVICVDSAILHITRWVHTPALALFGPISPQYRICGQDVVLALQPDLPCVPCNKNETCSGKFECMKRIKVNDVFSAIQELYKIKSAVFKRI